MRANDVWISSRLACAASGYVTFFRISKEQSKHSEFLFKNFQVESEAGDERKRLLTIRIHSICMTDDDKSSSLSLFPSETSTNAEFLMKMSRSWAEGWDFGWRATCWVEIQNFSDFFHILFIHSFTDLSIPTAPRWYSALSSDTLLGAYLSDARRVRYKIF